MIEQAAEADVKEKFEETLFLYKRVRAAQRESREPDYEDVRRIGQNLRFFKTVLPHSQFITVTQQGLHLPPALVLDYIQASIRYERMTQE
jgi:hypothetical protein